MPENYNELMQLGNYNQTIDQVIARVVHAFKDKNRKQEVTTTSFDPDTDLYPTPDYDEVIGTLRRGSNSRLLPSYLAIISIQNLMAAQDRLDKANAQVAPFDMQNY